MITDRERKIRYEEAKQFYIISRTAKGVRTDLVETFLGRMAQEEGLDAIDDLPSQITKGILWIPRAREVAVKMNRDTDGQWNGKIILPNEPRRGGIVSQKSFTDSMKPIVTNPLFDVYSPEDLAKLLGRYWNGIAEMLPDSFLSPNDAMVQRTTGVFVLHRLFPTVLKYAATPDTVVTQAAVRRVLEQVEGKFFTDEFWSTSGEVGLLGTSQKAFSILYAQIEQAVNESLQVETASSVKPYRLE